MKPTGHVRKVDELGRVVIPIELRNEFNIGPQAMLEIFVDGDSIVFAKHTEKCTFCSAVEDLRVFKERPVCTTCKRQLSKQI